MEGYLRTLGREISEMKGKLDQILDLAPLVSMHSEKITRLEESVSSAHKRITEEHADYKTLSAQMEELQKYMHQARGIIIAISVIFTLFGFILSTFLRVVWK